MKPEVKVIKKVDRPPERGNIPADRVDVLKTLEHIETQAARLMQMAQRVRAALTTK